MNFYGAWHDPPDPRPAPAAATVPAAVDVKTVGRVRGRCSAYLAKAFANEVDKVHDANLGVRNATLNEAAFSLGQLVPAGLDETEVVQHLTAAARATGLRDNEIAATIGFDRRQGAAAADPRNRHRSSG